MFNAKTIALWFLIGASFANFARAEVRLPRLISDGMVLQRDSKLTLWGWADPGESVSIQFHGQRVRAKADLQGRWRTQIGPFPAGGPFDLKVSGQNTIDVHNVMLGDVWVASGQSNMEFPVESRGGWMTGIKDVDQEVARAQFDAIRLFIIEHDPELEPREDVISQGWRPLTPESVGEFSAVAYEFGRRIHQRYGVPVGLIQSTFGGTLIEAWIGSTALSQIPEYRPAIDAITGGGEGAKAVYAKYQGQKNAWYLQHGTEDRGRIGGKDIWADPQLDVGGWPTIQQPRSYVAWARDFDGFDGVVWFRRTIALSEQESRKSLFLHLGSVTAAEITTYFNGSVVGHSEGPGQRNYAVPAENVHAGNNTVVIRLVGLHDPEDPEKSGMVMYGPEKAMRAETNLRTIPLAGTWSYQPGPDLAGQPTMDPNQRMGARPWFNAPTELFNGMIHPLTSFRIKGIIWYQGEQNADEPARYRILFPNLIRDWRSQWGEELPFLFVQLAGYGPDQPESVECDWAELREAQAMALELPKTGMATAIDLGDAEDIHPRNKQDVADRLALAAARVAYGENVVYSGPTYQSMQVEGNHIRVRFSNLGGGLDLKGKYGYVNGFEVAGKDHRFVWARGRIEGSDILVSADSVPDPVAVRYDWSNTPDGNVLNREGLPAVPFRAESPVMTAVGQSSNVESR